MSEEKIVIPIERRLKPCPFCGGEARLTYSTDNHRQPYVTCDTPRCLGCNTYQWHYHTEAEAIEAWNRRTEPEPKWIPFTMRELTTEEKEEHPEWDYIMDCELPDDGEEILVSNGKYIWCDTFVNDCDGCYLDGDTDLDGCAWMPLPEPYGK